MTAPDYQRLIDAETWAFIRETEAWYPPDSAGSPVARQREVYDAMCRAFFRGYPEGVAAADKPLAGVPCRLYSAGAASTATLVYLHGGGFVVGGLDSHDDVCAELCRATGFRVIAVDYRLAPEHTYPAAVDDALAVAELDQVAQVAQVGVQGVGREAALVAQMQRETFDPVERGRFHGVSGRAPAAAPARRPGNAGRWCPSRRGSAAGRRCRCRATPRNGGPAG